MHRAGWQWLLAVCALWAVGSACGKPPVESELTVAFVQPLDGQRLAAGEDQAPETEGFQYEVVAEAADTSGRAVRLAGARLELRGAEGEQWEEGPAAVLEGARARFPGVTLRGRTSVLRVSVEEEGSRRKATRNLSVTVGAEVPGLEITGPAEGQVLREVDDADALLPGYQVRFQLETHSLAGRTGTLYCGNVCGIPPTDFTVAPGGTTEVAVTLTEASCEAQVAECYAVVTRGSLDVASSRRSFTLDTVAPRVEVSAPVSPVASTTFRVEAMVGCCEDGAVATLFREGQPPLSASLSGGVVSFPEVKVPGAGRFPYVLRVTDAGGNATEQPLEVVVAPVPSTLSLDAPSSVFWDVDGEASNGVQVDVTATTDAREPSTSIEFYTALTSRLGPPTRVPTMEVAGGHRRATFRASLAEGSNTVRACVRNPALPPTCQSVTVNVSTGRSACRIVSPLPGAAQAGAVLPVQVETSLDAVTVRLRDESGQETSASGSVLGGSARVELSLPEEGSYHLVADCGASGVSQALTVRRDSLPPALSVSVAQEEGDSGLLGPHTRDTSPLPGTQVRVSVNTEPFATVALTGCHPSNSMSTVADAAGVALLREVTVPGTGSCTLSVTATDAAGNSTVQHKELTLRLTGSQVALVAPVSGRSLGAGEGTVRPGGGLTVDVRVSVSAGQGGLLRLFRGSLEVGSLQVEASDAALEKSFPGVALEEGANVLRATLTHGASVVACATSLLTVDTATRAITLLSPASSGSFGLAADRNVDVPGIQAPLQYMLVGASPGARVDICTSAPLTATATPCRDGSDFFTLATHVPGFVADFTFPDGQYAFKAVLDDGHFSATAPVSLVVDSVRPRVTRMVFEQDLDGDGQLNLRELSSEDPSVTVFTTGLEEGRMVQVRDANGGALFGQAPMAGGQARVSLTGLPNPHDARYSLVAVVTDKAGNGNKLSNPGPLDPLNTEALAQLRVDRLPPTLEFLSPVKSVLGPADDADSSLSGYQLLLSAATSADVGTEGVKIEVTPLGLTLRRTPSGLTVTESFTVPSSGTTLYTFRLQATDGAGNMTERTRSVTVDFEPPVVEPVSPTPQAVLDSSIVSLRANVSGADGQTVIVSSIPKDGSAPTQVAALLVEERVASGSANLLLGLQDVRFEVADVAGNVATVTVPDVHVTFVGCDQRFTRPSGTPVTLAQKDDLQPATPGLQYRIEGVTNVCKGLEVRLLRGAGTTPEAVTTADAASGAFGFDVTLPDGETTTLRLEMDDGATTSSVAASIAVDITPPTLVDVVPAATTLFYVADSNEAFFRTPRPANYIADLVPDGDAQAELSFRVLGARNGSVRVLYGGVDLVKPALVPDSEDKALVLPVSLPHGTANELAIVVRDAAGNETRRGADVTVDVRPPAAPVATARVVAGAERTASVLVEWSAVEDEGASGAPSGYDLRWTTQVALPGGITTDELFFSNKVRQASGALLPATTESFTLTPLPPLTSYSLQLRARDAVGNYSRLSAPLGVDNFLRSQVVANPGSGSRFGFLVGANGNLDGVPGDELVVADFSQGTNRGAVYVYSREELFPSGGGAPVPTQVLLPPDTSAQFFGTDFGIGNAGDAAGEGRADLLVGAPVWNSNQGRAFLYFGRSGAGVKGVDAASPLEFRGPAGAAGRFGITARIVGDLNRDGLGEVAISASFENGGAGRVYLFHGRGRADWEALRVDGSNPSTPCTASSTSCFIPASKADRIFDGQAPSSSDDINAFGRQRGLVSLGDVTGDGYGELAIPASREPVNKLYLYSGRAVSEAGSPIPASSALQLLSQTAGTERNRFDGFGTEACSNVNLVGGPARDLVVSHPYVNRLFVYADGSSVGFPPAATLTIQGNNNFGNGLACADINGDGRLDIVAGTNILSGGSVWVLFNQGAAGAEFEPSIGGFHQARLTVPGAAALGVSVAAGDFDGDGRVDVAAGDNLDPSGGRVRIWY